MYKLLVFDLDGTSADTDMMVVETMRSLFKKFAPEKDVKDEDLLKFSGPPLRVSLPEAFPHVPIEVSMKEFNEQSIANYEKYVKAFYHEKVVLMRLKRLGYKLAIVTNKANKFIDFTLKLTDLEGIFDFIVGYDDVRKPKPNPEGVEKCIAHFGVEKKDTLYIGDTYYDYLTAKNAGVDFALITFVDKHIRESMDVKFKVKSYDNLSNILMCLRFIEQ